MQKSTIFLIIVISLLCIFAYTMEVLEQPNIYTESIPSNKDTKSILYKKLDNCLRIHKTSIKWRRSFLSAVLCIILIFSVIYFRFPEPKEIILYLFTIYIMYYATWENFNRTISDKVENVGRNIIERLKNKTYNKRVNYSLFKIEK